MNRRIVLISGAGGGLGSIVARGEAAQGSELVLLGRAKEALQSLADDIVKSSDGGTPRPHLAVADIGSSASIRDALSPFERLDGLVNAAAVLGPVARFGEEDWAAWEEAIRVDLIGNAALCRYALPALKRSRRGKIVNFSGGGAAGVREQHSAYAAAKTAMVRLSEIMAREHPDLDINAIAPGAHRTGIWKTETHDAPPAKWADPARFSALVSYLLSDRSDGVSGKFIHINDPWEGFTPDMAKSEMYTLRRLEPPRK